MDKPYIISVEAHGIKTRIEFPSSDITLEEHVHALKIISMGAGWSSKQVEGIFNN